MPSSKCERCGGENIELTSSMPDGRKRFRCSDCRHFWWSKGGRRAAGGAHKDFPRTEPLTPEEADVRFRSLLTRFRGEGLGPSDDERAWRDRYRALFARDALEGAPAQDLRAFASARQVANPGPMSVLTKSWDEMGDETAVSQMRRTLVHLLHGEGALEDRATAVVEGRDGLGFAGFRETLTTKVLCVAEPERFIPILSAKGKSGKLPYLQHVFGVAAEPPKDASVGHLIVWSNEQLAERLRGEFPDLLDAAYFLRWTRTQP